jgi:hypothetical protein
MILVPPVFSYLYCHHHGIEGQASSFPRHYEQSFKSHYGDWDKNRNCSIDTPAKSAASTRQKVEEQATCTLSNSTRTSKQASVFYFFLRLGCLAPFLFFIIEDALVSRPITSCGLTNACSISFGRSSSSLSRISTNIGIFFPLMAIPK